MSDTNAVAPGKSALISFARDMKRAEGRDADSQRGIDPDDADFAELTTMPGWNKAKKYLKKMQEELRPNFDMNASSDEDFFSSYGMRSVIFDIVKSQFDSFIHRVEGAKDVVKEQRSSAD